MYDEREFPYLLPPCKLHLDPKTWEEKAENRRLMEKWNSYMTYYRSRDAGSIGIGTPGTNHPLVAGSSEALMLLLVGPSWPFVPERKVDLETWFGRPFTDEEIETFRTDPEMESQIVTMIAEQVSQGKLGDKFYDNCGGINTLGEFYGMALNEPGRQLLRQCASF